MDLPNVLCEVGRAYAKTGQYDRALQIAAMVRVADLKADLLADIADARAAAGQREQAAEHLLQALHMAHRGEDIASKAQALAVVGARYAQTGIEVDARARQVLHEILRELAGS